MIRILKCVVAFIIYLIIFNLYGTFISYRLKWKITQIEKIVWGFCAYFLLFEVVYLPFVLLKIKFGLLAKTWLAVLMITIVLMVVIGIRQNDKFITIPKIFFEMKKVWLYYVIFFVLGLEVGFIMLQGYVGWDTAYYIGEMNETLYTDTMYLYNGNTGYIENILPLRYALSGFYMQFTVCSKWLSIEPIVVSYYLVRLMCFFLACVIVYLIGMELFSQNSKKSIVMTLVWGVVNMFWYTVHATPLFMMVRSYEAKGYCANVVLPLVFYCLLRLFRDGEKKTQNWQMLFLIAISSITISMSALMTVPIMIGVGIVALLVVKWDKHILFNGFVCMLPNIIYLIVYLMSVLNIFLIEV